MKKIFLLFGFLGLLVLKLLPSFASDPTQVQIENLSAEINERGRAYEDLVELTAIGHRLSGSSGAEKAVQWAKEKMESYGFDSVTLQPVQVPHWVRGETESAALLEEGRTTHLKITALGNSVATDSNGLQAQVVEVNSLQEVKDLGTKVKGKIVFYNRPMDPNLPPFEAYGKAGDQRFRGPQVASQNGAVAAIVRSLSTLPDDDHPHTGMTGFGTAKPIPAGALSTHGANILSEKLRSNPNLTIRVVLSAQQLPRVTSHNVIGEIRGSERPEEYVVVGGHLDSWDLGTGAHDDGAGVVQAVEVLRAMKALGIRPKRTVRAVAFMSEEIGAEGAQEYARQARLKGEKHIAAVESDRGGFGPVGFSMDPNVEALKLVTNWKPYLLPLGAGLLVEEGSGTDVEPLNELGAATFDFIPSPEKYFHYHHSSLDQIEAVDAKDLHRSAAALAAFTYLWAENVKQ